MRVRQKSCLGIFFILLCTVLTACSSKLGWGVLLWSTEEPPIASGTVLPVYIRSNVNKVWVVGIPEGLRSSKNGMNKMEIPLSHLELVGSRKKAFARAQRFAPYALQYAENLQDGLPIRDNPDNNARRVYRLRIGEMVKILSVAKGVPAISATGDPLPGDWYQVLTSDGSVGYCFSYRLRLFEHSGGPLVAVVPVVSQETADPDLDILMSKKWLPELYSTMVNSRRINLEDLSRRWRFDPGQETGTARVFVPGFDRNFSYTTIRSDGQRAWRFEGTNLQMQLRSDNVLAVQFIEGGGGMRTLLFVSLPISIDDLIIQESARRERLYSAIYSQGPVFTSNNFGVIVFEEDGSFTWSGYDLLVPQIIPESVDGRGTVSMDLFLGPALEDRYNGAFTMRFTGNNYGTAAVLRCMYVLDNQGFRIEVVPESSMEDITVMRRAASPMVLYFFKDSELW
ncbi:MAG: SH3 domain-containing protein [Treponema sp.]|nr:SH3 domain-containing protein [Treponema sp.]